MRLWLAPRDLSAVSSVVLISRVPVPGTTVRGKLGLVCAEVLKWVVGDLSAVSAVVLISRTAPQVLSTDSSAVLISCDSV